MEDYPLEEMSEDIVFDKGTVVYNDNNGKLEYCIGANRSWIYVTKQQLKDIYIEIAEVIVEDFAK